MRKWIGLGLILGGILCAGGGGVAYGQSANVQNKAVEAKPAAAGPAAKTAGNSLFSLLPSTDLIATVDAGRLVNELLPKLATLSVGGVDEMAKQITEFTQKTGIDPTRIQNAVLAMDLKSAQAQGVVLLQGIDPDAKQIEAAMQAFKSEYKAVDYKGRMIYTILAKVNAPTAGPVSVKTDEMAVAPLGNQMMAFGDRAMIQKVIDVQTGTEKNLVSPRMIAALEETRASALVRFALNIPEELRTQAVDQGDLFKSVASIKMILGTFDVASDFSLSLDTIIRTATQNEAGELETGLKGLLGLIRGIFGGADPSTDFIGQLLDQIKIGSKLNDVSLSISLPRAIMDQLSKKAPPAEKK
ncbi:MAG: hypothetical protein ACKVX9_21220 [Blastocatellia bacterium]